MKVVRFPKKQKKQQHPSPPREKQRKSFPQNKAREIQITSALERKKRKRLSAAKFQQQGFSFGLACNIISKHLRGGKKQEKLKKNKGLPSKHKASCTSQHHFKLVPPENNPVQISRSSASFCSEGDLIDFGNHNQWGRTLRAGVDDHLCLGVFFFRFRLKKQQHLQRETDMNP